MVEFLKTQRNCWNASHAGEPMTHIVDHRIAGTRITVWDMFHHLENGWQDREIAEVLGVTQVQVRAALDYISEHESPGSTHP